MSIPNFDEVFGSRFVNAADLSGPVTVIIEKIDAEDLARPERLRNDAPSCTSGAVKKASY